MKHHRLWTLLTICWLFLLFNVERMVPLVNIASFVYVVSTLAAACMLLIRPLRHLPWAVTLIPAIVLVLAGKCALGYVVSWETLPMTLLEGSAIVTTQLLARRLGLNIDEFSESTAALVRLSSHDVIPTVDEAETDLQREMSRARRSERATTLVQLGIHGNWGSEQLRRFLAQLTNDIIRKSAVSHIGQILYAETKGSDIVARDDEEFSLLLPETDQQQASTLISRLIQRVEEETGLTLRARSITFPHDELTLEGLRDRIRGLPFTDEVPDVRPTVEAASVMSSISRRVS